MQAAVAVIDSFLLLRRSFHSPHRTDPPTKRWIEAKAEPSAVGQLRSAVGHLAAGRGMAAGVADDLRLCVSEAITNAVVHAFRGRAELGSVWLTAEVDAGDLIVHVRDDGVGLGPRVDSPGLGFGLPLMSGLAKELTVTLSADGGTLVRMSFPLGGTPPPSGNVQGDAPPVLLS
jgi:serine/threonine-protein kinase RsbW